MSNRSKADNLFDHVIGAGEQGQRDFEAERALAALKLMAGPVFVGSLYGRSAGFSRLTLRSTYEAERPPGSGADFATGIWPAYSPARAAGGGRSEERRVGKEC